MFLRTSNTNVSETGLGEGVVVPREDRVLAANARPAVLALRESLRASKVSRAVMGHRKDGQSITVHAKFSVELGDEEVKFSVHVMKDGAWAPGSFPSILKLSKVAAAEKLVREVANAALRFSGLKPASMSDFGSPEDRVRQFLSAALHDDLESAESRLRNESLNILQSPAARSDARSCWEGAVRHMVHKALQGMEGLPPELLHRLVDELYAKEIHDA